MNNYYVFTDEAGDYQGNGASSKFRRSHPFYIRSNTLIEISEYRQFQRNMQGLNNQYNIPITEEVKWSDLWTLNKGKPRTSYISGISEDRLKGYYRKVFEYASRCKSIKYIFTVTCIYDKSCLIKPENAYRFHVQDAFQRVSMELGKKDFAVFIMDEFNRETVKQIKKACHELTIKGDFLQYNNLYHGILIENSIYSPGIQLADYAAGAFNGFIRGELLNRGSYIYATDIYHQYIAPNVRCHKDGTVVGYGVIDVPGRYGVREKLKAVFDS